MKYKQYVIFTYLGCFSMNKIKNFPCVGDGEGKGGWGRA